MKRVRFLEIATFVLLLFAMVSGGILLHNQNQAIQQQRVTAIILLCTQSNDHHDAALRVLRTKEKKLLVGKTPMQVSAIKGSFDFTTLLVNQLAPKQNCEKVVASHMVTTLPTVTVTTTTPSAS